jgi:hypothetical protein
LDNQVASFQKSANPVSTIGDCHWRVKHFETSAHRIGCRGSTVSVVGPGAFIHTAADRAAE